MKPNRTFSKVKIFLKNGMTIEGVVAESTDDYLALSSEDSQDELIIYKPFENIIMMRVFASENLEIESIDSSNDSKSNDLSTDVPESNDVSVPDFSHMEPILEYGSESKFEDEEPPHFECEETPLESTQDKLKSRALKAIQHALKKQKNVKTTVAARLNQPIQYLPSNKAESKYEFPDFTKHSFINRTIKKNV